MTGIRIICVRCGVEIPGIAHLNSAGELELLVDPSQACPCARQLEERREKEAA